MSTQAEQPGQKSLHDWQGILSGGESSPYPIRRFCMAAAARLLLEQGLVTDSSVHCYKGSIVGWGGCHSEVTINDGQVTIELAEPVVKPGSLHREPCIRATSGQQAPERDIVIRRLTELGITVQPTQNPPQAPQVP